MSLLTVDEIRTAMQKKEEREMGNSWTEERRNKFKETMAKKKAGLFTEADRQKRLEGKRERDRCYYRRKSHNSNHSQNDQKKPDPSSEVNNPFSLFCMRCGFQMEIH